MKDNRYVLTRHALHRCQEMKITRQDVIEVINHPETDYTQENWGPDQRVAKRGDLAVVYNPCQGLVVTVLLNRVEQWDRSTDEVRREEAL